MISDLYSEAPSTNRIEVSFRSDGNQYNVCRALLLAYLEGPSSAKAKRIAARLQLVTTRVPGLGLFFVVDGSDAQGRRLLLSRFPADQGLLAEETSGRSLSVSFVEKVFLKSSHAYKSVLYAERSPGAGFWRGKVIDRQSKGDRDPFRLLGFRVP
jgi:hypothetical protein